MCRFYCVYYEGCGHTEDELLYMCPQASRICRQCEHPIRLSSPRVREKICSKCRPPDETWPLMGRTAIGYLILNFPYILFLLACVPFWGIYFILQKSFGVLPTLHRHLYSALQWSNQTTQNLVSINLLYTHRMAVLVKKILCTCLWPAVRSTLWWSIAIAMTPFITILAILEAMEDGHWPQLSKLFWKMVDISTGQVFKFYAMYFLLLSYFVAPASSVNKWLEIITKMVAPFQVAQLYTWYLDEAWDRLGDFWAVFTLSAVSTSILTSLIMTAPHGSVFSFLNRWVYAIVFILSVAELVQSFLGALYYEIGYALPRLRRQEMVQNGFSRVRQVQEIVKTWLVWIWQAALSRDRGAPASRDSIIQASNTNGPQSWATSVYQDTSVHANRADDPRSRAAPTSQDRGVHTKSEDAFRARATRTGQGSAFQVDREDVRYANGKHVMRWRRGSYERVRPA